MEASDQNGQAGDGGTPTNPTPATTKYVVQQRQMVSVPVEDDMERAVLAWVDIATVEVPQRSKRTLAVREALKAGDIDISEEGAVFRVLTEECAEDITARTEHTPQLVIG